MPPVGVRRVVRRDAVTIEVDTQARVGMDGISTKCVAESCGGMKIYAVTPVVGNDVGVLDLGTADSGIYGKYQKQDLDLERTQAAIEDQLKTDVDLSRALEEADLPILSLRPRPSPPTSIIFVSTSISSTTRSISVKQRSMLIPGA